MILVLSTISRFTQKWNVTVVKTALTRTCPATQTLSQLLLKKPVKQLKTVITEQQAQHTLQPPPGLQYHNHPEASCKNQFMEAFCPPALHTFLQSRMRSQQLLCNSLCTAIPCGMPALLQGLNFDAALDQLTRPCSNLQRLRMWGRECLG